MKFQTLTGASVNLNLKPYKIDWNKPSLSKFQTKIKNFLKEHFSHLDWYEEVPLVGKDLRRMRWDFVAIVNNSPIFVEVQGAFHDKWIEKFHKTAESFWDQTIRDGLKCEFAAINSNHEIIYFYEDDEELTLEFFEYHYPNTLIPL